MTLVALLMLKLTLKRTWNKFFSKIKLTNNIFKLIGVVNILLLATTFCFSQDCNNNFEGKVIDINENTPLEAAVIQLLGRNINVITDSKGFFSIKNLCPGKLKIKISHINCKDLIKEFDFKTSSSFNFIMKHNVENLNEVVLLKLNVDELSSTNKIHSLTELERERYSSKGLAGVLEQISGVNILSTGNSIGKPIIHGMFGSRVGIIYNDILLENQQWGQDHAPNVDVNAFESVRLLKGAAALKYSGSTPGGIIILEPYVPEPVDSLYGKTILNGFSNGKGIELNTNWVKSFKSGAFYKVQAFKRNNGDFSAPNYILSNTGNKENNFSFSFGKNNPQKKWKFYLSYFDSEVGILKSSHIGSLKDLYRAISNDIPLVINPYTSDINYPKQANKHYTANLDYTKITNAKNSWNIKYSFQQNNRKEFDLRRGVLKNTAALDLNLITHNLTTNYEWQTALGDFDSGIFIRIQDNTSNPNTGIKRLIPDHFKTKFGSYFTATFSPTNDLNIGVGLRYEYQQNNVQKFYRNSRWVTENYEPRLRQYVIREVLSQKLVKRDIVFNTISFNTGLRKSLSSQYILALNYNYSERAPDIAEMFSDGLHHALASIEYGNPFLKKETTQKFALDFEKNEGVLQYSLGPFLTFGKNYIIIEPYGVEQTIRGAFPVWEYSSISAIIKGIDFDLTYSFSDKIVFNHNTSWVEGKNRSTNSPIVNIPPLTLNNKFQFSIPNWKFFSFSINSKKVFSQNRFPNNNYSVSVVEDGVRVQRTVDVSTPPPSYHDLGVDLNWGSYAFISGKISFSLAFENILNTEYRNYLNRLRFYAPEVGRNVVLQIKIHH
jgi:iron complex outermembrane receptor protein